MNHRSTRRHFVQGAMGLMGVAALPVPARAAAPAILRAAPATAQIAPTGYPATPVRSYAAEGVGTVPGPELRVRAGERITRRLLNDLPQPSAVHWHGMPSSRRSGPRLPK